jgi:hypothetical protein
MKTMFKFLCILVISTMFIGCSNTIATERNLTSPYRVESIKSDEGVYCLYYVSTGIGYAFTKNNLTVRDSIGKFSIHDTVFVTLIKKHDNN